MAPVLKTENQKSTTATNTHCFFSVKCFALEQTEMFFVQCQMLCNAS